MAMETESVFPLIHVALPSQLTDEQGTLTVIVSDVPEAGPEASVGESDEL